MIESSDPPADGPSPREDAEAPEGRVRNVVEWVAIVIGALAVALVVKTFLIQAFFIPSLSMFPTLHANDRVLVNKLSYDLHAIRRGDLVVFERPPGEPPSAVKDLIKRVVALEGEVIEARQGTVYIDGRRLDEPYLDDGDATINLQRQTVPKDHVFVMGDNRDDSRDSRFFGPIHEDLVVGRAFIKVWPLSDVTLL